MNAVEKAPGAQEDAILSWMQAIAPHGILTTDAELRITGWNQWLETHSGRPASDVVGRDLLEVFPELAARKLDARFHRALAGEVSVLATGLHRYLLDFPSPVREANAHRMLQTARVGPLRSGSVVLGTITVIEDVTQREVQAAALRRQHALDRLLSWALAHLLQSQNPLGDLGEILEKVAASLSLDLYVAFLTEPAHKPMRIHVAGGLTPDRERQLRELLGAALDAIQARSRLPFVLERAQASADPAARCLSGLGVRAYAAFPLLVRQRWLGTISFGSLRRDTIPAAEQEYLSTVAQYVATAMDRALTTGALREAQEGLREHAEKLETAIADRTSRLHETIAQLESFSYTVAHDLRAPIRALNGYCVALSEDFGYLLPPDGKSIVVKLARASHRLDALTRDLLNFSKVSRRDVDLTQVNLTEVIDDIVLLTPNLQADSVVVPAALGSVTAHRTLVQQCLSNLFDNAAKFVAPGVAPRIVVTAELRGNEAASGERASFSALLPPEETGGSPAASAPRLRLWVADNGIGIGPESHEKIFGIFERVGGPDSGEGTGIGLAIVARAMQQMGGSCGVESELGKGSRFWLEFRLAANPAVSIG